MPTKDDLLRAIEECKGRPATYGNCEKLATFYMLLNELYPESVRDLPQYSYASEPKNTLSITGESEFLQSVNGKDAEGILRIIDEHMAVVKALFPKEYIAVIAKIGEVQ